ncbi:MAG TPA: hypothetical protein PLS49_02990 [Candidatus Woesebacteria bacterium]|nr:hypothetical protein [Candidatus Woesebacteria bacterium]
MIGIYTNTFLKKIIPIILIGLLSFLIAFFIDQYYIYDKKWYFILELLSN